MFYDRFIQLCRERDVRPTPLIVELGLSSSNAAQWKKGSTPRPQVLQRIAEYFGVPVSYFYETDEKASTRAIKGERDIKKTMETLAEQLSEEDDILFNGVPMRGDVRESILSAVQFGLDAGHGNPDRAINFTNTIDVVNSDFAQSLRDSKAALLSTLKARSRFDSVHRLYFLSEIPFGTVDVLCNHLRIDLHEIEKWDQFNELPPNSTIDKILVLFNLSPSELLSEQDLETYNRRKFERESKQLSEEDVKLLRDFHSLDERSKRLILDLIEHELETQDDYDEMIFNDESIITQVIDDYHNNLSRLEAQADAAMEFST